MGIIAPSRAQATPSQKNIGAKVVREIVMTKPPRAPIPAAPASWEDPDALAIVACAPSAADPLPSIERAQSAMWDSRKIVALLEGLDCEDLGFGGGPSDDFLGSGVLFDGEAKQDSRVVWRRTPLPPHL